MSDPKHGGLNGAYYGPAVPPRKASRSVGRGGSCSSCCCCLPCCLLSGLFKLLFSVVILLAAVVFVGWLVFRPNEVKAYAENASLTRFNLTGDGGRSLDYNLTLDISVRNPNKRIAIYYDYIEAKAVYDGYRFGYDGSIPAFFQDHKNTSVIRPVFEGQQALAVSSVASTFEREKGEGWFYVDVEVSLRVRFKVWFIKSNKYSPKIYCNLKLPVPPPSSSSSPAENAFSPTKCSVNFF